MAAIGGTGLIAVATSDERYSQKRKTPNRNEMWRILKLVRFVFILR
jgi:hypothetical protein